MVKDESMKPWEYEMQELGFNYRITDIQCALGVSQLSKLDDFIKRRVSIAKHYDEAFCKENSLIRPLYKYDGKSSYHLYVVRVDFKKIKISKEDLFIKLKDKNIGVQLHYIPINKQPFYRNLGYGDEKTPMMDRYYEEAFSLPMYASLKREEQDYVIETLKGLLNE